MTRKDYQLIADVLGNYVKDIKDYPTDVEIIDAVSLTTVNTIARLLANALEQENERFQRERFLVACGVRKVA